MTSVLRIIATPIITIINLWTLFKKKLPLPSFIVSRIASMMVVLFLLGFVVFGLMQLTPGDVVENYVRQQMFMSGTESNHDNIYTEEMIAAEKARLGLDKPFYEQYFTWLNKVFVQGDLGRSLISNAPILFLIQNRIVNSLILNLISLFFLTVISFLIGIYFSSKAGTKVDTASFFITLFLRSIPGFLLMIIMQMFASATGIFPISAYPDFPFSEAPVEFVFSYMHHITLPLITAFIGGIGGTMRMIRSTMLDELGMPYITAIRARGVKESRVYLSHAFRNTLNPYITSSADLLASLFSGSLIMEIIFNYPGIGRLMYEAVRQEDMYLVLTNIMFISFLVLTGMIITDIILAVVDPRIRYGKN